MEDKIIGGLILVVMVSVVGSLSFWIVDEYNWYMTPCITQEGCLLEREFKKGKTGTSFAYIPKRGVVPVFHSSSDNYITIWDIGKYGIHVCDKKNVFCGGKDKSLLEIKVRGEEVRIESITIER